jgi:hypothetical protein
MTSLLRLLSCLGSVIASFGYISDGISQLHAMKKALLPPHTVASDIVPGSGRRRWHH